MFFLTWHLSATWGRRRRPPASWAFLDDTLFMPNQILKRFIKNFIDFHKKFPDEKYFCDRKFSKSEIFDHDF